MLLPKRNPENTAETPGTLTFCKASIYWWMIQYNNIINTIHGPDTNPSSLKLQGYVVTHLQSFDTIHLDMSDFFFPDISQAVAVVLLRNGRYLKASVWEFGDGLELLAHGAVVNPLLASVPN